MTSGKIEFIENHRPALEAGDYTITVQQTITIDGPALSFPATSQHFSVLGPRFTLDPQEIQAVFPPAGSLGEHSNVLPHIILKRSTLPWERTANGDESVPWLALLLFDEDDFKGLGSDFLEKITKPKSVVLSAINDSVTYPALHIHKKGDSEPPHPYWEMQAVDHPDDTLTVIDVPKDILTPMLPSIAELKLLAHVRQTTDEEGNPNGDEVAVIICNHLPQKSGTSFVHLVSLEGRYDANGFLDQRAGDNDLIRLVSLYSWRFACISEKQSFKGLLTHLNHAILFSVPVATTIQTQLNTPSLPDDLRPIFTSAGHELSASVSLQSVENNDNNNKWQMTDNNNSYSMDIEQGILYVYYHDPDTSSALRMPTPMIWDEQTKKMEVNKDAQPYFLAGWVPLPHDMRQGNKSVSWYRGPLVPGTTNDGDIKLPIRSADELIRYDSKFGMFDVSYSAAWELGRLLTLQNKRVSLDLFNWKRSHAQSIKDAEGRLDHLPFDTPTVLDLPDSVRTWFEDLALLKGLPFNYLVPDERMLPTESIRFFQVDSSWVECMLDGAFSIGRVLSTDHARDGDLSQHLPEEKHLSGFLLRSDVVAGWPGLLIDGYPVTYSDNTDVDELEDSFSNSDNTFRTDLKNQQLANLKLVFQKYSISVSSIRAIDEKSWLITDDTNQKYYLVKDLGKDKGVQVFRKNTLPLLRMGRLSKNVLLCLFEGLVKTVEIHLKPETLHFGVSEGEKEGTWCKIPRDNGTGKEIAGAKPILVPFKSYQNVIDVKVLANKLYNNSTSAEFAVQMIEGVEKVRFVQKPVPPSRTQQ